MPAEEPDGGNLLVRIWRRPGSGTGRGYSMVPPAPGPAAPPSGSARAPFMLQRMLHPHRIRLVAGVGELVTPMNPRMSIGMDGPGFHLARNGIGELKQSGSLLRVMMGESEGSAWVNPTLDLLSHLTAGW